MLQSGLRISEVVSNLNIAIYIRKLDLVFDIVLQDQHFEQRIVRHIAIGHLESLEQIVVIHQIQKYLYKNAILPMIL